MQELGESACAMLVSLPRRSSLRGKHYPSVHWCFSLGLSSEMSLIVVVEYLVRPRVLVTREICILALAL